jgi:hypothetical protein
MRVFDFADAQHFCRPLTAHVPGLGQSLVALHNNLGKTTHLDEGKPYFEAHRISLLNAVERWILFGIANYRRALDMFIPSNAPWAHVTLYYSSFFGANAVLGMFGGWVHIERIVDVESGTPTMQVFRIHRRFSSPSGLNGSHQIFWDFFYEACNTIRPWVPPSLEQITHPVNNNRTWQIKARNAINYDMHAALSSSNIFQSTFNPQRRPLRQQLDLTEGMLKLAVHFANRLGVHSFAFEGTGTGQRPKILKSLVTKVPPRLMNQSIIQELFQ